jgi:hypothetical protein
LKTMGSVKLAAGGIDADRCARDEVAVDSIPRRDKLWVDGTARVGFKADRRV